MKRLEAIARVMLSAMMVIAMAVAPLRAQDTVAVDAPVRAPVQPRDPASAALFERLRDIDSLRALDSLARAAEYSTLHQAMIADRRHELTAQLVDAQRAFDLYYEVASSDSTAGWAFHGIGRIVAARPAVTFDRPGMLDRLLPPRRVLAALGMESQSRAQQALLRALVADPTIQQAALMIADQAVVSMDPLELEIAARALDFVTRNTDAAPEVWLALSRIRSLMADAESSTAAALTAMSGGADASLALLAAASPLLTQAATEIRGSRLYMEGTRHLSEAGAERYYKDLEQILDADDRRVWRQLGIEEKASWLRRWWEVRAGLAGVTVARSLGDHYRTVLRADRLYGGEYGEPSPVEQLLGTGDFRPNEASTGFTQRLEYVYDFYQFRGDSGSAITAALAVPMMQLRPMLADSQVVYGLSVSMILVDTTNMMVSRIDTVHYYSAPRIADDDAWLRAYVEVEQPARERIVYRLSVSDVFDPRTGALFAGPITIRDFGSDRVELSDIVLTRAGEGRWERGGRTFALTPAQAFATDETITIFYEIYNLPPETPYRTDVRVVPVVRGVVDRLADLVRPGSRSIRVSFEGSTPASGGAVQEVRTLQVPLRADDYVIEVTVTDLRTGNRTESSSLVTLTEAEAD